MKIKFIKTDKTRETEYGEMHIILGNSLIDKIAMGWCVRYRQKGRSREFPLIRVIGSTVVIEMQKKRESSDDED